MNASPSGQRGAHRHISGRDGTPGVITVPTNAQRGGTRVLAVGEAAAPPVAPAVPQYALVWWNVGSGDDTGWRDGGGSAAGRAAAR